MINIENSETDCGFDNNCCRIKKIKPWTWVILGVFLLTTGSIITIKLVGKNETKAMTEIDTIGVETVPCCDTTGLKNCIKVTDSKESKPCCETGGLKTCVKVTNSDKNVSCCPESE